MDKQSEVSDVIILPHSELMPSEEAQKKARALAEMQEQLLTMSNSLPDKLQMNKYLPDNPKRLDLSAGWFHFNRYPEQIHFMLISAPIFSQKVGAISLRYNTDNKSWYENSFQGGWCLSFNLFSDESLRTSFAQFIKQHPEEPSWGETFYLFNTKGNFTKAIRVHKDFPVDRQVMLDLKSAKDYPSKMTKLDFAYAEQALLLMHDWIEDYRQLN